MGGIGKTTLAQLAYNNEEVKKKFKKRLWVCVSNIFDEIRIVKAIIEELGDDCNFVELQSLLKHIHNSVAKKQFLLVLDDVWIIKYDWGSLYNCLTNDLCGNKILITTRNVRVARRMKSSDNDIIEVGKLNEKESWSLFKQLAFSDKAKQERVKLKKIGKAIVGKCKGLPLAVQLVGRLLCEKKTEQQWRKILDNDLWNLEEELKNDLFPHLLLSYNDLPLREKNCFAYCAVFPKTYNMDKNELIQLWIAQGYFGLEQNKELETIGQDCFDNLAMRFLFQEFHKELLGTNIIYWKMHDIVHDFIQFLIKNECFTMEINSSEAQRLNSSYVKTRHLTLILDNEEATFPLNTCNTQKLRSLYLINGQCYSRFPLLPNTFEKLTCLRALKLSQVRCLHREHREGIEMNIMIPKEVGKLIHLRYLNMSHLTIKEIPESLCDLYNLQTLNLEYCRRLEKLPQGMGKLINLRHLITSRCDGLSYMPRGVENLTLLRTLTEFAVGGGSQVCSLGSLENLNQLGLKGLGNVGDSAEAERTQLSNKKNLTDLELCFDGGGEVSASIIEKDRTVLEALKAPLNLERLLIHDYRGTSFPEWMVGLTQLKHLYFRHCMKCEELPALGKLPSLETLDIWGMENVKRVGNELLGIENGTTSSSSSFIAFPKLKQLILWGMTGWEDWDDEITRQITVMPSLSSLTILFCPKLKALPEYILHATSLKSCLILGCLKLERQPVIKK